MGRRAYSDETKAAVMTALLTGQSADAIAKEYNLPATTVRAWKSKQLNGEHVVTVITEQKERIGALLLNYVEGALTALEVQTRVFSDETWLRKQPASEAAVLHGVLADKVTRILEALSAGDDGNGA